MKRPMGQKAGRKRRVRLAGVASIPISDSETDEDWGECVEMMEGAEGA